MRTGASLGARQRERIGAVAVLSVVVVYVTFGLRTARNSLGCDFQAYFHAAQHWLTGQPIYDFSVSSTGTCGTYQYPPPFVAVAAPFSLLGFDAGAWLWAAFLAGCWAVGTAILPVRVGTRWTVLLLGAIGWPLILGLRLGQIAPILYVVFAFAWRSLDRPSQLGASVAVGAMVKLQPALLAVWLVSRRAWRALAAAAVVGMAVAGGAAVLGLGDWIGMGRLLSSLSDAVTVPGNLAIGATLHGLGMSAGLAGTVQVVNTAVILVVVIVAGLTLGRTPGFLVSVVASQLISPIVWSHYALILVLPVAWLLDRRLWWAAAIPVADAWVLARFMPDWTYTVAFYFTLVAVFVVGWIERAELAVGAGLGAAPALRTTPTSGVAL